MLLTICAAVGLLLPAAASADWFDCFSSCNQPCDPCCQPYYNTWYLVGGVNYPGVISHAEHRGGHGSFDPGSGGWGGHLFIGRQFSRCIALETGFEYLGTHHDINQLVDGDGTWGHRRAWVAPLRANISYNLCGGLKALLQVGAHFYDIIYSHRWTPSAVTTNDKIDQGFDLNFGVGLEYDFGCNWGARLVLDRYYINHQSDYIDSAQFGIIWGF